MSKIKSFLNDNDGISQRDFLLVISVGVFFLFVTVGLIMILFNQKIDPMYLDLLGTVTPVVITITSGIFGIQITQEFKKKNSMNDTEGSHTASQYKDEITDYEGRV